MQCSRADLRLCTWYRCGQVFPLAPVVSEPVTRVPALTGERGAGNDEWTFPCDLP